jgi:hypothetical protein
LTGHVVTDETRDAMSRGRIGMEFTARHCRNISNGKAGNRWVANIYTDVEHQVPPDVADEMISSGDWRYGRNEAHRNRVANGIRT